MLTKQQNRPLCNQCKLALAKPNGTSKYGFQQWHKYCSSCAKANYNAKNGYLLNKKYKCEKCGFVPEDKCQLDLIYKDGDRNNKEKTNLKTLCANCSRLYNKKSRDKKKSIFNITIDADVRI